MQDEARPRRLYRSRDVLTALGGVHISTLYRLMDRGFPKPKKLGNSSTNVWDAALVDGWIAAQLDKPEAEAA
jgi:predicted DNA-binding transcriptional regulator AlpA